MEIDDLQAEVLHFFRIRKSERDPSRGRDRDVVTIEMRKQKVSQTSWEDENQMVVLTTRVEG